MTSTVTLDPPNHRLKVRDRIRIPGAAVTAPSPFRSTPTSTCKATWRAKSLPTRSRVQGTDTGMDRDDNASRVPVNVYRVEGASPGQDLTS